MRLHSRGPQAEPAAVPVVAPDVRPDRLSGVEPDVIDLVAVEAKAELEQVERELLVRELAVAAGAAEGDLIAGAPDEDLVARAKDGDYDALHALLVKYRALARLKARSYFLVGAEREDIVQEGMIGIYKAVRNYNPAHATTFRSFAEVCMTRQMITAIKTATRQKHGPLNSYVSFSRPVLVDEEGERLLADLLPTLVAADPADLVVGAERVRLLQRHVDAVLSDLESEVLALYVEGKSYSEIAERLQRRVKTIDNALQRVKRKLEEHLRQRE